MTQHIRKNHKQGFSLLELSIVIIIIGMIAYGTIKAGMLQLEMASVKQTEHKLDRIENAISLYFRTYGYLPCPADPTLSITNANFGKDTATHTGKNLTSLWTTNCPTTINNLVSSAGKEVWVGIVPARTLGLPSEYVFDGWGNRITFVVSSRCVAPDNWETSTSSHVNQYKCSDDGLLTGTTVSPNATSGGGITIGYSSSANWMSGTTPLAAYITISHGRNGYGSYGPTGVKQVGPYAGDAEKANGNLQASGAVQPATSGHRNYFDTTQNDGSLSTALYYDDIVRFRTAPQIYFDATH